MFQKISGMEKRLWVRGGETAIFRQEILSLRAEKLRGVPSYNDIEILGYRKSFIHNRGVSRVSVYFLLCQWQKMSLESTSVSQKVAGIETLYA